MFLQFKKIAFGDNFKRFSALKDALRAALKDALRAVVRKVFYPERIDLPIPLKEGSYTFLYHKKILKTIFLSLAICLGLDSTSLAEYNLATKEEEYVLFDTSTEVKIGNSLARAVEQQFKVCKDIQLQQRIEQIGKNLAAVCDRKDITYFFTVVEIKEPAQGVEVNAFALPGGYIYVTKKMVETANSDDEIAGVLAHEIGHICARHSMKRLQASLGYNLVSLLALAATKDPQFKQGADLAFYQIMLGYSREDEFLADRLAVKYLRQAGYEPQAIVSFLEKLKQIEEAAPLKPLVARYARTHPYLPERLSAVKQEVYGKMDFNDYINRAE